MKTHGTPRPAYGMPLDAVRPDGRQIHSPGPRGAPLQNRQAPENGSLVAIQHSTRGARVSRKRGCSYDSFYKSLPLILVITTIPPIYGRLCLPYIGGVASLRSAPRPAMPACDAGPTSTVGSAEASSFGPRPAQGVFCGVHAAAKNGLDLFRAVRGANSVRHGKKALAGGGESLFLGGGEFFVEIDGDDHADAVDDRLHGGAAIERK